MDSVPVRRPRVSRETRLLVTTALLAVLALWLLARLRFPETSAAQPVVPPLLATLAPRQGFADLAEQLADVSARTSPSLLSVRVASASPETTPAEAHVPALRIRGDLAVVLLTHGFLLADGESSQVVARDPVTGLTVIRVEPGPSAPPNTTWARRNPSAPRYVIRSQAFNGGMALLPTPTGGLAAVDAPAWSDTIWAIGAGSELSPGTFVFTIDGELVGLAVRHAGATGVVPGEVLSRHVDRTLAGAAKAQGTLGIEVHGLTRGLHRLTGEDRGAIVAWVAPAGPAAAILRVGDVLQAADGRLLPTIEHWRRYLADLRVGASAALSVRRDGESREVVVTAGDVLVTADAMQVSATSASSASSAASASSASSAASAAFATRAVAGVGSEVTSLVPGSRAAKAGLRIGDLITSIDGVAVPTPAQVRRLAAARTDRPILLGIARGGTHYLLTLEP